MDHQCVRYEDAVDAAASLHDRFMDEQLFCQNRLYEEYVRGQVETIARLFPVQGVATEERCVEVLADLKMMVRNGTSTR